MEVDLRGFAEAHDLLRGKVAGAFGSVDRMSDARPVETETGDSEVESFE